MQEAWAAGKSCRECPMWGIGRELEVRALPANQIPVELGADEYGRPVVATDRALGGAD
jgi:hypothetical protein